MPAQQTTPPLPAGQPLAVWTGVGWCAFSRIYREDIKKTKTLFEGSSHDGAALWSSLGSLDGKGDGRVDGTAVGAVEGALVGNDDGTAEGNVDGALDGTDVGAW